MAGNLANEQRLPGRALPHYIERLNRWSARPVGLWMLQAAGMAAAAALGFGLAQRTAPADLRDQVAAQMNHVTILRRTVEQQQAQLGALTEQNATITAQLGQKDRELKKATAGIEKLRTENDQMKKAAAVFVSSRRIVLPSAAAPLAIRLPAATVVAINRGAKEGVVPDGTGGFVVVRRPSAIVAHALKNGLKKPPRVGVLTPLPQSGRSLDLRSPIATVVRPGPLTFRWVQVPDAVSYTVVLLDERGVDVLGKDGQKISPGETAFGVDWTVPRSLPAGNYRWHVLSHLAGGKEGKTLTAGGQAARFAVLESKQAAELLAAEAQYAGNGLELGVRYARLGLLDEAEAALIPFVAAYPDSPQLKRMLEQVRNWRRFKNSGR